MSATRRNIIANIMGRLWGVASVYLFVPLYLRFLGPEAYGVVGFYVVLQGMLSFADMGLSATMSREMARLGSATDLPAAREQRRDLARSLEVIYAGIALMVGLVVVGGAPGLAGHWLHPRVIGASELVAALRLMGLALALQVPVSLYFGGLLGLERQVTGNGLQIVGGMLRSGGSALVLALFSPTLRAFFGSLVIFNVLFLLAMRAAFWRELAAEGRARFRLEMVRRTWRYSAAMAGMSLLSTLLTQIDKLVVSRLLPLEVFAHYSLAAALAQSPPIIGMAVASAVFPRLTALVAAGRNDEMRALYHRSCQLVAAITLPFGLTLAAFAPQVLLFWTHSPATAETAGTAARLLLIGSTALTLQLVPYHLALAFGWVGLNLRLALVSLFVIVPVLWWLVAHIGLDGAGWAWCLLNVGTTPVMIVWLHRRVLAGATWPWVLSDVGRPLVATTAVLAAIWAAIHWFAHIPPSFTLALAVGAIALTAAMAASPSARSWLHPGGASVSDA